MYETKNKKKQRRSCGKTLLIFSCYGGISSKNETFKWENEKKMKKTCFFLLSCFAAIFLVCLYKMSIRCHVIGFNFLIENYDIIDNFGSFGSFFLMWSIFVNVISTLCYSQNKKDKKHIKADLKNRQTFLLYPRYLKLQWFSIDLVWDFSLVLFVMFYFVVIPCLLVLL